MPTRDIVRNGVVVGFEVYDDSPPSIPSWSDENLPDEYWWIYPGPFKDRIVNDYAAIAASDHPVCRAFIALTSDRQYIDLKGSVGMLFDALIASNQPEASVFVPGSGPMTLEKKAAALAPPTSDYERYIKGLPQPTDD